MKIRQLIQNHSKALTDRYGRQLLPSHRKALDAMLACRRHCGEFYTCCDHCQRHGVFPLSCGHRSCPQCQHHLSEAWLSKQTQKQLPVPYFMVTLTIPRELRALVYQHQSIMYDLLFKASVEALQTIGKNNFAIEFGMTGVLHTHKRDKGYHPHIHMILPAGGIHLKEGCWKPLPENYLINELALAKIFRGVLLRLMFAQAIDLPYGLPAQWVAHIRPAGRGKEALKYLSRYLYRGVMSENDILIDEKGDTTFRYQDSQTRKMVSKTLPGEDFIWRLLKHVLPRGFRRVRDFGFLHGNARKTLAKIQAFLQVTFVEPQEESQKMHCPDCHGALRIDLVLPKRIPMRFRFYVGSGTEHTILAPPLAPPS